MNRGTNCRIRGAITQLSCGIRRPAASGFGMVEYLVALGIFSTVMVSVLATQLSGKRLQYEALQRSQATSLARDMLEIVQANARQAAKYAVEDLGESSSPLEPPAADCSSTVCTASELATFDLWRWERSLRGASERNGTEWVGGLEEPRACVRERAGVISVAIVWRAGFPAAQPPSLDCGNALGLYDAPGEPAGNNLLRRQLLFASYVNGEG